MKIGDHVRSNFYPNHGIGTIRAEDLDISRSIANYSRVWFVDWEYCVGEKFSYWEHELYPISPLEELALVAE